MRIPESVHATAWRVSGVILQSWSSNASAWYVFCFSDVLLLLYSGPAAWNILSSNLHDITNTSTFRKRLKYFLIVLITDYCSRSWTCCIVPLYKRCIDWLIDWFSFIFYSHIQYFLMKPILVVYFMLSSVRPILVYPRRVLVYFYYISLVLEIIFDVSWWLHLFSSLHSQEWFCWIIYSSVIVLKVNFSFKM